MDQKVPKDANVIYECSLYQVDFRENPLPCAQQLNALLSQLKLDCALLAFKVMDAKVQYALLFSTGYGSTVCELFKRRVKKLERFLHK